MNHDNKFSVIRFGTGNGAFSFRVDGSLNGVRIRRNFKTWEEAAAKKAALELKAPQMASNLHSVAPACPAPRSAGRRHFAGWPSFLWLLPRLRARISGNRRSRKPFRGAVTAAYLANKSFEWDHELISTRTSRSIGTCGYFASNVDMRHKCSRTRVRKSFLKYSPI